MTHTAPQITLRPLDPADFQRVAEMHNLFYPNEMAVNEAHPFPGVGGSYPRAER